MNWNKKLYLLPFLLLTLTLFAQKGPGRERIKTLKVAFLTERLSLTPEEAQAFWPVYNAHEDKVEALRRKERARFGSRIPYLDELSEKEASELLAGFAALQNEKHRVDQTFIKDLAAVIPSKKIMLMFKAEEDFKRRLLQQVRKNRN
ncbi:MAG: hypothetical protein AAGB24_03255 [Bacteroidota bacterium]